MKKETLVGVFFMWIMVAAVFFGARHIYESNYQKNILMQRYKWWCEDDKGFWLGPDWGTGTCKFAPNITQTGESIKSK